MQSQRLFRFGDTKLPPRNPFLDIGPVPTQEAITELPYGGMFDHLGSVRAEPKFPYELTYDAVIQAQTPIDLETRLDVLRALVGTKASLYRMAVGEQWCTARLMSLELPADLSMYRHVPASFRFQMQSTWHGILRQYSDELIAPASPKIFTLHNGGNLPVTDMTMTFTVAGTATPEADWVGVWRTSPAVSIEWDYTINGTLEDGDILTIEFGQRSIYSDRGAAPVDEYAALFLDTLYNGNWLILFPGDNSVTVAWTEDTGDVTPTITFEYYDRWA